MLHWWPLYKAPASNVCVGPTAALCLHGGAPRSPARPLLVPFKRKAWPKSFPGPQVCKLLAPPPNVFKHPIFLCWYERNLF